MSVDRSSPACCGSRFRHELRAAETGGQDRQNSTAAFQFASSLAAYVVLPFVGVVFSVVQDHLHVHNVKSAFDSSKQTVLVAADVEHDSRDSAVKRQGGGCGKSGAYMRKVRR